MGDDMKQRIQLQRDGAVNLFYNLHYALKCLGPYDDGRWGLMYAKVAKDKLYCSDGHCLGVADLPEKKFSPGFYIPFKNLKTKIDLFRVGREIEVEFPDVEKFVKTMGKNKLSDVISLGCSVHPGDISGRYTKMVKGMSSENTINYSLFSKFCGIESVSIFGEGQPIMFSEEGIKVYVMPMLT